MESVNQEPQMSEAATLGNIFFEPGNTFEDLRRKPRFIMAAVITALLFSAFSFALYYKVGDDAVRRSIVERYDRSPQGQNMPADQKKTAIDMEMSIGSVVRYVMPVIVILISLVGGLLYWGAAKAFGGTGGFLHAFSVWVYSSLPPMILSFVANVVTLIFKSPDDIDYARASQLGTAVNANLSFLIDGKANPVLAALASSFDLFAIWGWVLAAIGLRVTNKISSGSAWTIVIIFALIGIAFRLVGAFFS
jgi:hypothetical protein